MIPILLPKSINNIIDGFQKTASNTLIGKFPSLESLFSDIESIEDDTIDILDEIELSIDEMRQMLNLEDIYEPLVSKKEFQRIEQILNVCSNTLKIGK